MCLMYSVFIYVKPGIKTNIVTYSKLLDLLPTNIAFSFKSMCMQFICIIFYIFNRVRHK